MEALESRQMLAAGPHLALYEFTNHTSSTPELLSTDLHEQTTAGDISSPLALGSTGNGEPPRGLALGWAFDATTEPTPVGEEPDYFEFTITPDAGYSMDVAAFRMEIRRNDPDSMNSFSVYFDEDPGVGGDNFSTKLLTGVVTSEDVFETFEKSVEGMPEFSDLTTPLTFRVYAWGTVGTEAMRLDNIAVQGVQETVSGSSYAYYGDAGRLIYPLDSVGNRIPDFSMAGYQNGNEPIPDVTQVLVASRIVTVSPIDGDDMETIQAALDQVGAMPMEANGFRGMVQLTAGEFQISGSLFMLDSGVVLRGVGDGDNPADSTILRATGTTQRTLIVVGSWTEHTKISDTTHSMTDKYVPVGATSFTVDSTANWTVGDEVMVHRPSTAEWIAAIGMDSIPPKTDGTPLYQWEPGTVDQFYERRITRIEGNRVFLDAPLMNAFQQEYGGGTVYRYSIDRIHHVGIESLRGKSDFTSDIDEDHARSFIELRSVEDAWVRNVTGQHFIYAAVHANRGSKRVTVDDARSLEPKSEVTSPWRYPFLIEGQFILMQNLYSEEARHDFVNNSAKRNFGPNVFLNGTAVNSHSGSGPHQRWSTGTLYDSLSVGENHIDARNRGNWGTGHGWAGAQMVIWNCTADSFIVQNPPTAQNWLIGSTGRVATDTRFGPQPAGTYDAVGTPVDFGDSANPGNSLYVAQFNERVTSGETREYVLGDFDDFQLDVAPSADDVYVDADWMNEVQDMVGTTAIEGFDEVSSEGMVPFSFEFALTERESVSAAILTLAVRGTGGNTSGDTLWLDSTDNGRLLAELGLDLPLATDTGSNLILELTDTQLDTLQDGRLNLLIGDDTAVDWAVLKITVETQVPDLGAITYREKSGLNPAGGPVEYLLQTTQAGYLTIDVESEGGGEDLTLALLDAAGNETFATGTPTDEGLRLDWAAEGAGEAYRLQLAGSAPSVNLTLVNLVELDSSNLTVGGSPGDDSVECSLSNGTTVAVNGMVYEFDADTVTTVTIDTADGDDTVFLRDSAGDETLHVWSDRATLTGPDHHVEATGYASLHAYAVSGGNDTANLYDTAKKDKLKIEPKYDSVKLRSGSFQSRAKFFDHVFAHSTSGGDDFVRLWDTKTDDEFRFWPDRIESVSKDGTWDVTAEGFQRTIAYATAGGHDVAKLHGSTGDDDLRAKSHKTTFAGPGFELIARKFEDVVVSAEEGGYDRARLFDSPGDDLLNVGDSWATMHEQQAVLELLYSVANFEWVKAYSVYGGNDTVRETAEPDFEYILHGPWQPE
jgi:hypothetical protein